MNPILSMGKRGKALIKKHIRRQTPGNPDLPRYEECTLYNEPPPPYTEFATIEGVTLYPSPPPAYTPNDPQTTTRIHERLGPINRDGTERTSGRSMESASSDNYCRQSPSTSPELRRRNCNSAADVTAAAAADVTAADPRSWTDCLKWIAQYSLEDNFRKTVEHFLAMVQSALRIKQRQDQPCPFLLSLDSITARCPPSLGRRHWEEMVFGLGFELPRCLPENRSNTCDALPSYVIVPTQHSNTELVLFTIIFQGILDLPFNVVRMMAYLRKDEMDQILFLLSFVVSHPAHRSLSKHDYLIQPVWDLHRRPGCLLREMGFQEVYHSDGRRSVLFPRSETSRQRVQLVTDILRTFQYGDTTRVILV